LAAAPAELAELLILRIWSRAAAGAANRTP
jgi:hypothetical protein